MRITFAGNGSDSSASILRYEVAWCFPQPEFRRTKESPRVTWWLDLSTPNEQAANARLQEIQAAVSKNKGSIAIYEVQYDNANRIMSERIIARAGGERPPFRFDVQLPASQLKTAFAELVNPPSIKQTRRKSDGPHRLLTSLMIAGGFAAVFGVAVFFAGNSLREASERDTLDKTIAAERLRNEPGRILVPRRDSLCDRLLFDNNGGGMRVDGAVPCGGQKASKVNDANSFSASWRGAR